MFQYTFKAENEILESKKLRDAAAVVQLNEGKTPEEEGEEEEKEEERGDEEDEGCKSDGCEVIQEPHPTNPFLAVSGDVLIPTAAPVDGLAAKSNHSPSHLHLVDDFDANNSNPFDGAELQSLSDFDALKSVLAPEPRHDLSLLKTETVDEPVYADVTFVKKSSEPVYSTVNKAPKVIKSKKGDGDIEISSSGPPIHNDFTAVHSSTTFGTASSPPAYEEVAAASCSPFPKIPEEVAAASCSPFPKIPEEVAAASCSPFPKIPEAVVARAMQRLDHNQEDCFLYLQEVVELMSRLECSAEVAEAAALLSATGPARDQQATLIKQFTELGFKVSDIVWGLKQEPSDRDALLDLLVSNS